MKDVVVKRFSKPNSDFIALVKELDKYLAVMDGEDHDFYDQFNSINLLENIVIAYVDGTAAGCGAFKPFDKSSTEIKRMYVNPSFRRSGIAMKVLKELENWSKEIGFQSCLLETGKRQTEAIKFYSSVGYHIIPNFDQYIGMENSLCFKKEL